jgi:hypothetical protein
MFHLPGFLAGKRSMCSSLTFYEYDNRYVIFYWESGQSVPACRRSPGPNSMHILSGLSVPKSGAIVNLDSGFRCRVSASLN